MNVGHGLRRLTDAEREAVIRRAAKRVEYHMAQWEASGHRDFRAKGFAEFAQQRMEDLIKGRSPETVARLARNEGVM